MTLHRGFVMIDVAKFGFFSNKDGERYNVTSPIQDEETLEPPLDAHWDYKLLRAKAREVLTELEYETLQNALTLACKHYTQHRMSLSYSATMKLGRIFHD